MMQTEVGEAFEPAGARPRRLLDHAAQAQSGRRGGCAGRRRHGPQSGRDDLGRSGPGP